MRGAELLNSMELVDFRYVEEADTAPVGRPSRAVRWAAAACLCLCLAAALAALLPPVLSVYFVTDFSTARSAAGMTAIIVPE